LKDKTAPVQQFEVPADKPTEHQHTKNFGHKGIVKAKINYDDSNFSKEKHSNFTDAFVKKTQIL